MIRYRNSAARGAALALLLAALPAPGANAQLGLVSEKQELEAGREADAKIQRQYHISRNRDLNGLVNHLGRRLARVSERPDLPWTFRVIESREVNAFSVPGYVYVNTGLLDAVGKDQDALAGVIAHEIGHTTGRHAVKQMENASIGGLLGSLIAGRNRTVGALLGVTENLVLMGHSRGDEYDADRRAVRYTVRAGYDPKGIVRFFEKLKRMEGSGGGGLMAYFRTHPATGDRIKRVEQEIPREEAAEGGRD